MFDIANRNNTSIYAVDPRGLAAFEYDVNQGVSLSTDRNRPQRGRSTTLRVLADNTDGRAIVNRNDLAAGMKQIMRDASGYYLLGYTSTAAPTDGKFHSIDVHVKRPGVEVRSAQGLLGLHRRGRRARDRAAQAGPAQEIIERARRHRRADDRRARGAVLDRHGTGGRRAVAGDLRLGAVRRSKARARERRAARVQLTATAPDGRPLFRGRVPARPRRADAAAPTTPGARRARRQSGRRA